MPSLLTFTLLWSRVALGCYFAGLGAAVLAALMGDARHQDASFGVARGAIAAGFLFQFVALVEGLTLLPLGPFDFYRVVTSLLAFIIAAFFLMVYRVYSPRALSLVVAPLLCALAAAAAWAPSASRGTSSPVAATLLNNGWLYVHITLIFLGYAGLVVAMASGVMYLLAQRGLKAKNAPRAPQHLFPPLETLDQVAYRSLLIGFPLLTAGLAIGAYWATTLFGRISLNDPTVLLALLAWTVYLVLLFARWSAGWRGRRSAYLTLVCFGLALAGWLANGLSRMHSILLH